MPLPVDPSSGAISHAIQLAVAPVFLMTGIAGMLNVMTTRLSRVIDRARTYDQRWPGLDEAQRAQARREIQNLERRRRVCSWSITFSTSAALLVCLVIVVLFADEFFPVNLNALAAALFVAALVALIAGLSCFLREVYLATHATAIDQERFH